MQNYETRDRAVHIGMLHDIIMYVTRITIIFE